MGKAVAVVGVSDHCGWAALVTATRDGTLLDRRRVELIDDGLPKLPHHHEAQGLPIGKAIDLIDRVRGSAERHAMSALDAVAAAVPARISGIALRDCPALPPTIPEILANYRAQNVADTVMYRRALAAAAEARGWTVKAYAAKTVLDQAAAGLRVRDLESRFRRIKETVGPPWGSDQRIALAAAIAAGLGLL